MRIKKAVCFLAVLCMLTAMLSGCGEKKILDAKNPVSIEIWHYYNGPQKTAFDELVTEFNDTVGLDEGIVVEAFSQGNNVNELIEKVIDAANQKVGSGDIPDVFAAYADTAYQVDQLGLVAELDSYLTEEELAQYVPAYIEEGRFDAEGHLKIFPTAKSSEVFMLNKTDWDRFAEATGAKLEDLETMEGLVRTAEAYYEWTDGLTEEPNDGKAFFGRDAMANYFIIGCRQLGTEIFEVNQGKVKLNVDDDIMRKLWDNFYVPYINGYFGAYGRFRSDDAKTGDLIALVGSTSGAAYFPDKVTVDDSESYDIEPWVMAPPHFEGGELYAVQQGAGMVVTKSDEKKEYAATVFLKWFTEAQRNIDFSVGSGYLPVKTEANDMAMIEPALKQSEESSTTKNLEATFPVAIEMTKTHTFYTNKAFEGGTAARNVLENSMMDQANADRAEIVSLMQSGVSRKDAVARFDTDDHFNAWLTSFKNDLNAAIE
ncbi:extracellular solute-binding protein [Gehongia tenuis]|nr:extracellular solute-binding protein [Gehongia tenuis]